MAEIPASADVVVVGGGSAGAVMAARLSQDPARRVVLVEAGPDTPPGRVPAEILDSYPGAAYFSGKYHWNELRVGYDSWAEGDNRPPMIRRYEQARIMGGGSSMNGMFAVRGPKSDYDSWAAGGATGWSFDDVLPYLRKLERDTDFPDAERHGADGPVAIRRIGRERWPGFTRALDAAVSERGHGALDDSNGTDDDGVFPFALTNWPDQRVSTALAYLTPEVRARDNLVILDQARLVALEREGRRVTGVRVARGGEEHTIISPRTVIAAGVFHSPPILMRAGIGPGDHLREHGIEVVADRPGVGAYLHDHPSLTLAFHLKREARIDPAARRRIFAGVRYSSGHADCPAGDMFLTIVNRAGWHPLGAAMGTVLLTVNRAYGDKARDMAKKSFKTWWQTKVEATLLDASAATRRFAHDRLIHPESLDGILSDDHSLEAWIRENTFSGWHGVGTCRMGAPDDPQAVVDPMTRVIGVDGLYVADASIMPSIVCGNTNLTTIMIGEKAADLIAAWGS
ncbi:MAG: hypothetical protein HOL02_21315 [Rhodospirillaceae bacterium]|nr:hypothetical protein [Rhodospirillaceae bacterium]